MWGLTDVFEKIRIYGGKRRNVVWSTSLSRFVNALDACVLEVPVEISHKDFEVIVPIRLTLVNSES